MVGGQDVEVMSEAALEVRRTSLVTTNDTPPVPQCLAFQEQHAGDQLVKQVS